jgi:hypothetical protein
MENVTVRQYLERMVLTREIVDRFLDPKALNWAAFDSELGYKMRNCVIKNGMDGSYTFNTYLPTGERKMIHYSDQPCRVNTYGDSMVQCHQVSDGETWQEYLAAHLGEPIRNFGVGGYGVYQAYRRILKMEDTASSAEYIILNVYSDDHYRSIYKWRMLHIPNFLQNYVAKTWYETCMFHTNPWVHLRLNPETGKYEEHENPYPTPESLYLLCDKDHVYQAFKDDFEIQAMLAQKGVKDIQISLLEKTAQVLGIPVDFQSQESSALSARNLIHEYAIRSTLFILQKLGTFIKTRHKKLLILLHYTQQETIGYLKGLPLHDKPLLDFLQNQGFQFVDYQQKHLEDFKSFRILPEEYTQRYFIGHYNPKGNHFIAFSIKDEVVDWLNPKPPAYRSEAYFE